MPLRVSMPLFRQASASTLQHWQTRRVSLCYQIENFLMFHAHNARQGVVIRGPNRLLDSSAANMALLCVTPSSFPRVIIMATQPLFPCFARGIYLSADLLAIKVSLCSSPGKFSTVVQARAACDCATCLPAAT
jgi:hypothetical protein